MNLVYRLVGTAKVLAEFAGYVLLCAFVATVIVLVPVVFFGWLAS